MGNFDSRRPGPEALTTEAITAVDSLGTNPDHSQLRALLENGGAAAVLALATLSTGTILADNAMAQENLGGQSGYPGPENANQGYPAPEKDSGYPGPQEEQQDQEPTVDPEASATPSPTGEATVQAAQYPEVYSAYLPFALKPRGTESTETTPIATGTVGATLTATEVAPTPTHTDVPPTATSAPTNTAVPPTPTELPIATETPASREINLGPHTVISMYKDRVSPWGEAVDILGTNRTAVVLGVVGDEILIDTPQGRFLTEPPSNFETVGLKELEAPLRTYTYATIESPVDIRLSQAGSQPLPLLDTFVHIGANQGYEYHLGGAINKGSDFTLNLPNGSVTLRRDSAGMKVQYTAEGDTNEEPLEELLGDQLDMGIRTLIEDGQPTLQILGADAEGETRPVIQSFKMISLPEGDLFFSINKGTLFLNALSFTASENPSADGARKYYRDRIGHGIFEQQGLRIGMSIYSAVSGEPDFIRRHGGVQNLHVEIGPSAFMSEGEWEKAFYKHQMRAAELQGATVVRTISLTGGGRLDSRDGVTAYLNDVEELGSSGPLAISLIDSRGKINIPVPVLQAFELDRSNSTSAATILTRLEGRMMGQRFDESEEPVIRLDIPMGFNMSDADVLLDSIQRIVDAGANIEGVYLSPGENPANKLEDLLKKLKEKGLYVGLQRVWANGPISLTYLASLSKQGLIDEITFTTGTQTNPSVIMRSPQILDYVSATSDGPISGTPLGDLWHGFQDPLIQDAL